jgi:putative SOS response-associated peptidase YedK
MCGRYVTAEVAAMERFWHLGRHNWVPFLRPSFNVAPTSQVPIILRDADGALVGETARWGLIPSWWKQPEPPAKTFNARSEEASEKPMWREALKARRCLVPVRGWYEWTEKPGGGKQPYFIHAADAEVLALAGLWSQRRQDDGELALSCAVLTCAAATSIAHLHHRMPVVLRNEHQAQWLDPATPAEQVRQIVADARTDFLAYAVSTRVNNTRNNAPDLMARQAPVNAEQLPLVGEL